jgi:hypothetical protein
MKPGLAGAAVGINEHQDFKIGRELFNADAEIVDLFTRAGGPAGDDDVSFDARGCGNALDERVCGIAFGSEDKKEFEVLVIEFAEGDEIALEAGFHATARAENSGAGSVKARVGAQAAAHVGEPLDTLPKQEEARGDLENRQKFEESLHATRA